LAGELEKYHSWDRPSRDEVESLDEVECIAGDLLLDICRQWVRENNITPPYPAGSMVTYRNGSDEVGEITGICERRPAYYEIKKAGHDDEALGWCRTIVEFEDVELIKDLEGAA
jgi:hypothetical protein